MKKTISLLLAMVAICITSCQKNEIPELGAPRPQLASLEATAGDGTVTLEWKAATGANPTEFIISYLDVASQSQEIRVQAPALTYTVSGLENGYEYTFSVQAVYGTLISQGITVKGTPVTVRIPVSGFHVTDNGETTVSLAWTKPSENVLNYKLLWQVVGGAAGEPVTVVADAVNYTIENLESGKVYTISIVAVYAEGESKAATATGQPGKEPDPYKPITVTELNIGETLTLEFNITAYPDATDVKWTVNGTELAGTTVTYTAASLMPIKGIKLSATVKGATKSWDVPGTVIVNQMFVWKNNDWGELVTKYGVKGSCPVFSPDGQTVYINNNESPTSLHAFDVATGTKKWCYIPDFDFRGASYNMITVNPITGDIYLPVGGMAGVFFAIKSDGTLKWKFTKTGEEPDFTGKMQSAAPAVSADGGTVYICDGVGNVFAINAETGAKVWGPAVVGKQGGGILVLADGDLLVGTVNNDSTTVGLYNIFFVDGATGTIEKKLNMSKNMTDLTGFAVSNDKKTAYVPCKEGYITAIDLTSRTVKTDCFNLGAGANVYEPVVAPDGTICLGGKDGNVYLVDAALTTVKKVYPSGGPTGNAYNYSHPVADADSNFYITSGQLGSNQEFGNKTIMISSEGVILKEWTDCSDGADYKNQKQMGGNNYIGGILFSGFIGSSSELGYLVANKVGGERATSWSSHGGDICGSCCIK